MNASESESETEYSVTMEAEVNMEVVAEDGIPEVMAAASHVEGDEFTVETASGHEITVSVGQITETEEVSE